MWLFQLPSSTVELPHKDLHVAARTGHVLCLQLPRTAPQKCSGVQAAASASDELLEWAESGLVIQC